MFLKKLYNFNKATFFLLLLLLSIYIYINFKWGVTATPVYQYGMFSNKMYLKDTQTVYKIFADDKLLDLSTLSFEKRDMLLVSLQNYSKQIVVNDAVFNTMKLAPQKIGVPGLMKPGRYRNTLTDENFTRWYKKLLAQITGKKIQSFSVYQHQTLWNNNILKVLTPPQKINFIVDN